MPDRFKVSKADASDIDATYHSILKDKDEEAAAVLGKLLPPSNNIDSRNKKGMLIFMFFSVCLLLFICLYLKWYIYIYITSTIFRGKARNPMLLLNHISLHFAGLSTIFPNDKISSTRIDFNKTPSIFA